MTTTKEGMRYYYLLHRTFGSLQHQFPMLVKEERKRREKKPKNSNEIIEEAKLMRKEDMN